MIVPIETIQSITTASRIAGLLLERDAATVAQMKALPTIDEILAGLLDAADDCRALAVLCERAHDLLMA